MQLFMQLAILKKLLHAAPLVKTAMIGFSYVAYCKYNFGRIITFWRRKKIHINVVKSTVINVIIYNMNQRNPPVQSKNKLRKNFSILSLDRNYKSGISCVSDATKRDAASFNTASSEEEDSKSVIDYCKSSIRTKTASNASLSTRKLWNNASRTLRNSVPKNDVIEEESELIDTITKQLHLAESQLRTMQGVLSKAEESLRTKDTEIGRLKRKVKEWENKYKSQELLRKKELRTQATNSDYFYQRCLTLERKIIEMERFLTDYGLIWVGDVKNPTTTTTTTTTTMTTTANDIDGSNDYINAYYDQLVANIDQLNIAAGKGEVHIHHNEKGRATFKVTHFTTHLYTLLHLIQQNAKYFEVNHEIAYVFIINNCRKISLCFQMKTPSCMSLKFYKNGMTVKGGPLRSYDDPTVNSFIRDILDGYFPSELQREYPEGVPFMIEDHRTEVYAGNFGSFPGHGYRLGKQSPDNLLSTNSRWSNISQKSGSFSHLSRDSACNSENIPLLSLPTSRLLKSKASETSSLDLFSLRSQILASHNNACSHSHLQSHINAELVRSSREKKKEVATKNIEYMLTRESLKCRDTTRSLNRPASSNRMRYHCSSDRSSSQATENNHRLRSRSASLSGRRLDFNLQSKSSEINNTGQLKLTNIVGHSTTKYPRGSKSATCARKSTPPLLHQINEATGKPDELRLKIRSLTGTIVYLVHISADESVTKLYELLNKMQTPGQKEYKVVLSGYSPKKLARSNISLRESGISRDCVLHLVND
ncbi:uncharacterized protein LOC109855112 isoform X2 [Pseudomyrmex gracilis]|uniref:uncharacterized protein LOC109855112 isoform X2 n=1 Tax=Pseudomyrmex gracilis TaxID=219809 RepID=UPI000995821A|nr:uncharacterized protein LOC109855112 isoform X2 [Pseudomyrmex gracilis]